MARRQTMAKQWYVALILGLAVTFGLFALGSLADAAGFQTVAEVLFWQNFALQALVPLHNVGTVEQPFTVPTSLNIAAFLASFPLGMIIYGVAVFFVLRRGKRRGQTTVDTGGPSAYRDG